MDNTVVTGLFTLGGTFLGALIPFINNILNNKTQIRLERIRLHEKDRLDAHRRLYNFARMLTNKIFPMVEKKKLVFIDFITTVPTFIFRYDIID